MQNPSKDEGTVDTGKVKENPFLRGYERKQLRSSFLKKRKKRDRKTGSVGCDSLRIGDLKKTTYTTIIVTHETVIRYGQLNTASTKIIVPF